MERTDLKALRTRAHSLDATLVIGEAGLSDGLLDELDRQLAASELVEVMAAQDVLSIGKVVTLWRSGDAIREANQPTEE